MFGHDNETKIRHFWEHLYEWLEIGPTRVEVGPPRLSLGCALR